MFSDWMPSVNYVLYAIIGGTALGIVLGFTRAHMTPQATFFFTMLYYFLFTGLLNIHRYFNEPVIFHQHALAGFERALIFAIAASITVWVIRGVQRRRLERIMAKLEADIETCKRDLHDI